MPGKHSDLSVTILGSGTCIPSLRRSSCSVLVETGGTKLVFDAGPGTMRRLLETGISIFDISHIFFSHFHPDHTAELVPLLFATQYPGGNPRKFPLTLVAGPGFLEFYNGLHNVYGKWIELAPDMLNLVELKRPDDDSIAFETFSILSIPVSHRPESLAYRVQGSKGSTVVYSGDTDVSENLVGLAKEADLLICESSFPDDLKVKGHLTPAEAGDMASRAKVKKLVLTHFYPACDGRDIEKECRHTYAGPLILAEDLMKIEVAAPA